METDDVGGQRERLEGDDITWDLAQQPGVHIDEIIKEYKLLRSQAPQPISSDYQTAEVQRIVRTAHVRRLVRQILSAYYDSHPQAARERADEIVGLSPRVSDETVIDAVPSASLVTERNRETTEKPVTSPPPFEIIYADKGTEPIRICFHTSVFADWDLEFFIKSFGSNRTWNKVSSAGDISELEEETPGYYTGVMASYYVDAKSRQGQAVRSKERIKATVISLEDKSMMEKFKRHFDQVAPPNPDAAKYIMFVDIPEKDLNKFRLVSKKNPNAVFRGTTLHQLSKKPGTTV